MGRTVTEIRTPDARTMQRVRSEKRLRLTLWRIFAVSVMLRHASELVAAQGGAAGWWLTALCMLPGLAAYGLLAAALHRCGCTSIPEMVQQLLGKTARRLVMIVTSAVLVIEGMASLAALATVFVDGVGTTVSAVLFTAAAAAVLCLCTERDGLLYGAGLLRWVLGAFAAVVIVNMAAQAQIDHLFPPGGDGRVAWMETGRMWWSIGWPLILLLYEEPPQREGRGWFIPPVLTIGASLALCLALPHELLTRPRTLAERMLLPGLCLEPGSRVLLMCLWTAGMGLTAVIASVRAVDFLPVTGEKTQKWLPRALLAAFAAGHALGMGMLEKWLDALDGWMLAPFALLALILFAISVFRRKRA